MREEHFCSTSGDGDDATVVAHAARGLLKRKECAFGIGAEDKVEVGLAGLDYRFDHRNADIGKDDIDRTQLALGFVEQASDIGKICNVGLDGDRPSALGLDGGYDFLGGLGIADIVDDDGRAIGSETLGNGAPDTARTASDNGGFALKRMRHDQFLFDRCRPGTAASTIENMRMSLIG